MHYKGTLLEANRYFFSSAAQPRKKNLLTALSPQQAHYTSQSHRMVKLDGTHRDHQVQLSTTGNKNVSILAIFSLYNLCISSCLLGGKTNKSQHFKTLRMQAFFPEGIKSRRTMLLHKAASPSPPRAHGHIAKQQCSELTDTGPGNWTAQKGAIIHNQNNGPPPGSW